MKNIILRALLSYEAPGMSVWDGYLAERLVRCTLQKTGLPVTWSPILHSQPIPLLPGKHSA